MGDEADAPSARGGAALLQEDLEAALDSAARGARHVPGSGAAVGCAPGAAASFLVRTIFWFLKSISMRHRRSSEKPITPLMFTPIWRERDRRSTAVAGNR